MLCPRISHYFPIVHSIGKRSVANHCAEVVVGLAEEQVAEVGRELHISRGVLGVPCKLHKFTLESIDQLLIKLIHNLVVGDI
jgi:hypothetical protein